MYGVISYGCATTAGNSVEKLWESLNKGTDHSKNGSFLFHNREASTDLEILTRRLTSSFRSMMDNAPASAADRLLKANFGIILASTKGRTNDFIWNPSAAQLFEDPLTPLLNELINSLELRPKRSVVVSNACSSALAASKLAQMWLQQGMNDVLIFAADAVTDFVRKGFDSLKLLSDQRPRPFSGERNGFLLGEAAACFWLSQAMREAKAVLHPVGLDSEGSAVTRPTLSGESLVRAGMKIPGMMDQPPQLIVAHGTGTIINDQTEDLAFARLFQNHPVKPLITGSKWCVGHTLAASGAVDLILACEIIRTGQAFRLHTTAAPDPNFSCSYLLDEVELSSVPRRVMVSSLGFGGMHAVALVEAIS